MDILSQQKSRPPAIHLVGYRIGKKDIPIKINGNGTLSHGFYQCSEAHF